MKWTCILCLAALATPLVSADELHLRDGTVMVGNYIGGSSKEVWFQRTPAGPEVFPLFQVESLKFNTVPTLGPGITPGARAPSPTANPPEGLAAIWMGRLKWAFALFLPPTFTAQLAHPAH